MTKSLIKFPVMALLGLLLLTGIVILQQTRFANAAAPIGLPASVATTSTRVIGPTVALNGSLFGSTTNETALQCSSRIISTQGGTAILLSFSSQGSTTLSGGIGAWQAASTTVGYDSGIYGCGYWTAFAYSTTTITISETR